MDYNPDNIANDILIEVPDTNIVIDLPNKPGTVVEVEKWALDDGDEEINYKSASSGQQGLVDSSSQSQEIYK